MGFYVIEQSGGGVWVSSVVKATPPVINYSSDIEQAMWHEDSTKVQQVIDRNNISNVTTTYKGFDHPGSKPHIP